MLEKNDSKDQLRYRDAGVDIDAGNMLVEMIKPVVETTLRPEVLSGLGGFGGLFQLEIAQFRQPVLVSGTDGVGSKLMLARALNIHHSIGIDLVAMCVNDILTYGAEPLFFLDYFATGTLRPERAQAVISGIAQGCRQAGCALIGGETAEMPGMYKGEEYDLAGFAVGVVEREKLIDGSGIRAGHRVLGLASSGPHSNGYSLIRKVLEVSGADTSLPLDTRDDPAKNLGQALLAPTRIYVSIILDLLKSFTVDGLAHITGGGLTENIVRIIPDGLGLDIDLSAWTPPAVFRWLQDSGNISESEMLRTFNHGIGMTLMVSPGGAADIRQKLECAGEKVFEIGLVRADSSATGAGGRVRYIRS